MYCQDKQRLIDMVKLLALEYGTFRLKSGATSNYYLDLRRLTLHSEGIRCLADLLAWKLRLEYISQNVDAIGGPCVGADPIIGALLYQLSVVTRDWRGFLVRSESKDHGKAGRIIGSVKPGDRCLIVEDVVTTASSVLDAIDCLEEYGARVVQVVAVVDRLSGAREAFAARGLQFLSLLTVEDLGVH